MDWKLELVQVPVSDVDRAKAFYAEEVRFDVDLDHRGSDEFRVVQLTPPGSACSIAIGTGLSDMPPGSVQGLQLVVSDIEAARAELVGRGVEASEVRAFVEGEWVGATPPFEDWNAFVFFSDPDGNGWALQQAPALG
jgi:predicted enzyme related to lactoylglutathione lyase